VTRNEQTTIAGIQRHPNSVCPGPRHSGGLVRSLRLGSIDFV
jgi:hypothetical protein